MKRLVGPLLIFGIIFGSSMMAMAAVGLAGSPERLATDEALAQERAAADAALEAVQAQRDALQAERDALAASLTASEARVVALEAQVIALQASLDALTGPTCDLEADSPGALQAAPNGSVVCMSGSYTVGQTINVPQGVHLVGPVEFVGSGMGQSEDLLRLGVNVTLEDVTVSGAGRHGVACSVGTTVIGGRFHHNGKDGIGCDLEGAVSDITVTGTELDYNGTDPYWLGRGAAGAKFFHAHGVTLDQVYAHHNVGNGLWCDAHCGDFTVTDSTIALNSRKGIFYEKGGESDGTIPGRPDAQYVGTFVVTGNVIIDNDTEGTPSANAGVSIYSSKNALVYGNVFDGQARAIIAREDAARLADEKHGWHLENVTLGPNVIHSGEVIGCGSTGVTCVA